MYETFNVENVGKMIHERDSIVAKYAIDMLKKKTI